MKRILTIVFISAIFFISCKKDRVCNCTITTIGTTKTQASVSLSLGGFPIPIADTTFSSPLYTVNDNKSTFKKVRKRVAKNNCFNKAEDINESTPTNIPGFLNVTVTNTGTRSYNCKLE